MIFSLTTLQMPLADFMFSIRESHVPGRIIVLLLFIGSIYAWTIMISKFSELSRARTATRRFLLAFRKEKEPTSVFVRRQKFPDSPLYEVYEKTCIALAGELETISGNPDELFMADFDRSRNQLSSHQLETLRNIADRLVSDENLLLENRMNILATAVTTAPFLGLLGTVWGVMSAFAGMAVVGTATLSAVAPGIAAALMTTVMGLLVALPSTVGHNLLIGQISQLQVETSNFLKEFMDKIRNSYLQGT